MRFARGDIRDHIALHNNDHGVSYRRYGVLPWRSRLKILEIVAAGGGLKPTRALYLDVGFDYDENFAAPEIEEHRRHPC
jgi:hypothetical protein